MIAETDTASQPQVEAEGVQAVPADQAPVTFTPRVTRARAPRPKLDTVAAAAVDLARAALDEAADPGTVGEHLATLNSGERMVTHVFACTMPGYTGWAWHVVLTRAPRAKQATVSESALLPGREALLAPVWEPWAKRLKPSDVSPDDTLPYLDRDPNLEPGYQETDPAEEDRVAQWELGLGRERVLSPEGRTAAAERWDAGEFGPREVSKRGRRGTVTQTCISCGYLLPIAGAMRQEFGICTNEWAAADGRVVSLGYGCGSHSETGHDEASGSVVDQAEGVVMDELALEFEERPAAQTDEPAAQSDEPAAQSDERAAKVDEPAVPSAASDEPTEPAES
jgi:hypothetical protein